MLLNRFMLTTDYDTQKEKKVVDIVASSPSITIPGTSPGRLINFEIDASTESEVTFDNIMIVSSLFDYAFSGDYAIYDDGEIEYQFLVTKPTTTNYHFWVRVFNYSGRSVTLPAFTITARVHQFIPSTKED